MQRWAVPSTKVLRCYIVLLFGTDNAFSKLVLKYLFFLKSVWYFHYLRSESNIDLTLQQYHGLIIGTLKQ